MKKNTWILAVVCAGVILSAVRAWRWRARQSPEPAYMAAPIRYRCTDCAALFSLSFTELVLQWKDVEVPSGLDGSQAHCGECGGTFSAVQVSRDKDELGSRDL